MKVGIPAAAIADTARSYWGQNERTAEFMDALLAVLDRPHTYPLQDIDTLLTSLCPEAAEEMAKQQPRCVSEVVARNKELEARAAEHVARERQLLEAKEATEKQLREMVEAMQKERKEWEDRDKEIIHFKTREHTIEEVYKKMVLGGSVGSMHSGGSGGAGGAGAGAFSAIKSKGGSLAATSSSVYERNIPARTSRGGKKRNAAAAAASDSEDEVIDSHDEDSSDSEDTEMEKKPLNQFPWNLGGGLGVLADATAADQSQEVRRHERA